MPGVHHFTAIAGGNPENFDFYTRRLGLMAEKVIQSEAIGARSKRIRPGSDNAISDRVNY
jgi:hypothetical protein